MQEAVAKTTLGMGDWCSVGESQGRLFRNFDDADADFVCRGNWFRTWQRALHADAGFDASDVAAVGEQTLGGKAGENFNTFFHNGGATSTKTVDGLPGAIADAVWDESWLDHFEVTDSFAEFFVIVGTYASDAANYSQQVLDDTGTTGVKVASNGMDSVTLPAGIITSASINNGAITNAKFAAGAIDAAALAADVVNDIWMGAALTEDYASQGAEGTPAQLLYMLLSACTQFEVDGQTIRCKELDGTTDAMTFGMDSATNPTLRLRS